MRPCALILTASALFLLAPSVVLAADQPAQTESPIEKRCSSHKREVAGTLVGAGAGGVAGYAIAGKEGALIGGALGALGGNLLGKKWDKDACKKADEAIALALATGATQSWQSADGKKSFTYVVERKYTRPADAPMQVLDGRAISVVNIKPAKGVYVVKSATNMRDQPTTTGSKVFETVAAGRKLAALGTNETGEWLLLSSNGRTAEGWVSTGRLTLTSDDPVAFAETGTENRPTKVARVAVAQPCMDTREILKEKDKTATGAATVCQDAGGSWQRV